MKMILKQISVQNFKGCKERVIDFSKKTAIKGQNGSGKTTIADAFSWVLFNKDSSGSTNFDIRPKDQEGNDIDFIDIQVALQLVVDGKPVEIIKTQKQKWFKKRGSENQTFEGNENLYEINTIPKSEKEFKAYIEEIVPEEVFKFVSNTNAFMALKPAERRETLFKLVSEVTDQDVLNTDDKLRAGLSDQLAQFTSEEIMSRDAKALKEYKRKQEEIPARIDEVSKTIVEVDYSAQEKQLLVLKKQLEEVEGEIQNNSKGYEEINRIKNEIAELKGKISDIERAEKKKLQDKRYAIQVKIDESDNVFNNLFSKQKRIENDLVSKKSLIDSNEKYLEKLGNDFMAEKVKELDQSSTVCPTCHQELPAEMKENLINNFDKTKENKLYEINILGKDISTAIKKDKEEVANLEKQLEQIKNDKVLANANKNKLADELEALPSEITQNFLWNQSKQNADYATYVTSIERLEDDLSKISTASDDEVKQSLINRKREIRTEIDNVNKIIAGKAAIESAKVRIMELKEEQKELAQSISNVEKEIYLLEEFNKAKVNLLSEKINQHFKVVKWKLFERQINGGYKPVCEPMVNGQAYNSALNSGHKILAELDIIQTLQEIYGVQVPVFLDNAERINNYNIPDMECQLISLSVTDDKELKVVNE